MSAIQDSLTEARELWSESHPENYSFQVTESCECAGWEIDNVVLDDRPLGFEVLRASHEWSERQVDAVRWPRTADALFQRADEILGAAQSTGSDPNCPTTAQVTFDEETGIPLSLSDQNKCGGYTWKINMQLIEREGDRPPVVPDGFGGASVRSLWSDNADISLAPHVDGVVFVLREGYFGFDGYVRLEDVQIGTPCASTSTTATCQSQIDALADDPETPVLFVEPCSWCPATAVIMIVTTDDDEEPRVISTPQDVFEVVGPVDSAIEVMLVTGQNVTTLQRPDGRWTILTHNLIADCDPIIHRSDRLILELDGSLTGLDRWYSVTWGVCH